MQTSSEREKNAQVSMAQPINVWSYNVLIWNRNTFHFLTNNFFCRWIFSNVGTFKCGYFRKWIFEKVDIFKSGYFQKWIFTNMDNFKH